MPYYYYYNICSIIMRKNARRTTNDDEKKKKKKKDGLYINDRRNQLDIASTAGIVGAFFVHVSQQ